MNIDGKNDPAKGKASAKVKNIPDKEAKGRNKAVKGKPRWLGGQGGAHSRVIRGQQPVVMRAESMVLLCVRDSQ